MSPNVKLGIIAAGDGSRMKAEGIDLPKPLVNINGVPLIERIIRAAVCNGVTKICCIVNERSPELRDFLMNGSFGAEVNLLVRSTPSSMHSLFALAPMLGGSHFCLTTADAVFHEREFSSFLSHARCQKEFDGILAVTQFVDDEKPLAVLMDQRKKITAFSDEKGGAAWVTGGIYYFSPLVFRYMESALERNIERLRNFLRLLLENNYTLQGYPFSKIVDVDHVHDVAVAEEFLQAADPRLFPNSHTVKP